MPCTTILVGKNASYNGSTMIARNDDSPSGQFTAKRWTVVSPEEQPKLYRSVISHVEIDLTKDILHPESTEAVVPMQYTAMPNADVKKEGIWAAAGVNACNVAMTATETITSNERVLAADPLVEYKAATETEPEQIGGIGEEDIVVLVLPYIHSAKEGVQRLGALLEQYGTYEMNGIGFSDTEEVWWLETIGGHHWIAKRVPDDSYVAMPNQLGIDEFDMTDALVSQNDHMCSADLLDFIIENHLDLEMDYEDDLSSFFIDEEEEELPFDDEYQDEFDDDDGYFDSELYILDARAAFGSHDDSDHVYNTPRAWFIERYFNKDSFVWDGEDADFKPESDDIPWCMVPDKKITSEDVKYVLSSHYQGTEYDPYAPYGDHAKNGMYRSIGINRNDFMALLELRADIGETEDYTSAERYQMMANSRPIEWICYASNAFNTMAPFYANVDHVPNYLSNTTLTVSTDNFYWTSRLIAALTDAGYKKNIFHIERYQQAVMAQGRAIIQKYDRLQAEAVASGADEAKLRALREEANEEVAAMLKKESDDTLNNVLYESSNLMKNQYSRSDA